MTDDTYLELDYDTYWEGYDMKRIDELLANPAGPLPSDPSPVTRQLFGGADALAGRRPIQLFGGADTWWLETREGFYLARLCVDMHVWPTGAGPKPTDGQFRFHLDHLLVPEHDEYSRITDRERQHWWLKLYKRGWSVTRLLESYKAEWSRWHEEDPYAARRAAAGRLERGLLQAVCEAHDLLMPELLATTRRDRELRRFQNGEPIEACQAR